MRRLLRYAWFALATPVYAGAPAGHNNRVLRARIAVVGLVAVFAAAAAAAGVGLSHLRTADSTALAVGSFGFVLGLAAGWAGRRAWGAAPGFGVVHPPNKTAPSSQSGEHIAG